MGQDLLVYCNTEQSSFALFLLLIGNQRLTVNTSVLEFDGFIKVYQGSFKSYIEAGIYTRYLIRLVRIGYLEEEGTWLGICHSIRQDLPSFLFILSFPSYGIFISV